MTLCFPAQNRLKNRRDFDRVFRQGKKHAGRYVCLHFVKNDEYHTRIGLTVSKKVDKRAVRRNLIKRRLREIFRNNQELFPEQHDIILRALPGCADAQYGELKDEVLSLAEMAGLKKTINPADQII